LGSLFINKKIKRMGRLRLVLYTVVCIWVSYQPTNAQVKLPELFSSNMVLQRNAQVAVWGWASANANIIINTSWMESPIEVKADNNGHWSIKLTTTIHRNQGKRI
jgi:sialate O-acetylesterase